MPAEKMLIGTFCWLLPFAPSVVSFITPSIVIFQAAWHGVQNGPKAANGKKWPKDGKMAYDREWEKLCPRMAQQLRFGVISPFSHHIRAIFFPFWP